MSAIAASTDWPVSVEAVPAASGSCLAVASVLFRHRGALRVGIIAKATFDIVPERPLVLRAPDEIVVKDRFLENNASRSLREASDIAPYKPRVDVTLVGHACTPGGHPASSVSVRLMIGGASATIDRVIRVYGDRDAKGAPQPFTRLPLVAERAALSKTNPVGTRAPNLLDPRDPERAAFLGPIARIWPSRKALLAGKPAPTAGASFADATANRAPEYADDFDWRYHQSAPEEQQLERAQGDEWIILEGVAAEHPRIRAQLPAAKVRARAVVPSAPGGTPSAEAPASSQIVELALDAIAIDADRMTVSLGFRQSFPLHDPSLAERLRVQVALALGAETAIEWPTLAALAPASKRGGPVSTPEIPLDRTILAEQTSDLAALSPDALAELARLAGTPFPKSPRVQPAMPDATATLTPGQMRTAPDDGALPFARRAAPTGPQPQAGQTRRLTDEEARALGEFAALPFQAGPATPPSFPAATGDRSGQTVALGPAEMSALKAALPFAGAFGAFPADGRPDPRASSAQPPAAGSYAPPAMHTPPGGFHAAAPPPSAMHTPPGAIQAPSRVDARPPDLRQAPAMIIGTPSVGSAPLPAGYQAGFQPVAPPPPAAPEIPVEPDLEATPGSPRARVIELLAQGGSLNMLEANGAALSKLDFSGRSLQNAQLDGANLRGAKLVGCDLSGARLHGADLTRAKLDRAVLTTAELKGACLEGATFDGARLEGASFDQANGAGAIFTSAKGADASFARVTLPKACFDGAALQRADFKRATIEGATAKGADLEGASFEHATLGGASFSRAKLKGAVFAKAKGSGIAFDGADLTDADAKRASFIDARFGGATLAGAVFERADLTGADLRGAKTDGADFAKATLEDVKRDPA